MFKNLLKISVRNNIYRVISNIKEPDNAFTWAVVQIPFADELRENYPEVKNVVRFIRTDRTLYKNGHHQFYEEQFYRADSTLCDMFTYEFLSGDPNTALDEPYSMVLTEKIAKKYFADAPSALGQSLQDLEGHDCKVTGVSKDIPLNSHFRFDALLAKNSDPQNRTEGHWGNFAVYTSGQKS